MFGRAKIFKVIRNYYSKIVSGVKMYTREDLFGILKIISFAGSSFDQRTRLHKLVCIAKTKPGINYPFSFEFCRYFYGPYSFELRDMTGQLVKDGVVEEKMVFFCNGNKGFSYNLTEVGKSLLASLESNTEPKNIEKIKTLFEESGGKKRNELVDEAKKFFGW